MGVSAGPSSLIKRTLLRGCGASAIARQSQAMHYAWTIEEGCQTHGFHYVDAHAVAQRGMSVASRTAELGLCESAAGAAKQQDLMTLGQDPVQLTRQAVLVVPNTFRQAET